jgi:hypothetical protein
MCRAMPSYEVPKNSSTKAIYAASFWFAGFDQNGTLRTSAPKYNPNSEIFPGPISSTSAYNESGYTSNYASSIWTVYKSDIEYHIQNYLQASYTLPSSLANWPGNGNTNVGVAENLAPFIDVDGDNIYNPMAGDFPDIRGDIASYIIMNDASNVHTEINGQAMGIEVHIMAYQYASMDYLNNTTFLNVRVFNRGDYVYSNFKIGFYMDADLGNYLDDFYGCIRPKNLIYTYNADGNDESNGPTVGYGANPPCIGAVCLSSTLNSAGYYSSTSNYPYNDPIYEMEVWNVLNARWSNGSPWSSNFQMNGNPYLNTGENEVDLGNPAGDRRMLMSLDSMSFLSGESICVDFAIIYSRQSSNLHSVQGVIDIADSVQQFFNSQIDFNCEQVTLSIDILQEINYTAFPNPSNGKFTLSPDENWNEFNVEILDLSGRIVRSENFNSNNSVEFDLHEKSGIYLLKVTANGNIYQSKLVLE